MAVSLGIDIGSTTVKIVVIEDKEILFKKYERHFSNVREKTLEILKEVYNKLGNIKLTVAISGSAGYGIAENCNIPFIQEVYATSQALKQIDQKIDIAIELGGEDAKILFLTNGLEERMNGTCAGGTGAFIDQMATLLNVSLEELDNLSLNATRIYPIASRCGVFAKSDIQPLLNQGAKKEDIAASIFQSVVNQTITGLAQGRKLKGRIAFLGGPLYFFNGLKERFIKTLNLTKDNAVFPELGQFSVAIGTAIYSKSQNNEQDIGNVISMIENISKSINQAVTLNPLFNNPVEYEDFKQRHKNASVKFIDIDTYEKDAFLGIDCGSTTTKIVLISENADILYSFYGSNMGNPVDLVKEKLIDMYKKTKANIKGSAVTGYGEDLIKNAFHIDAGIVETMAHFKAAKHFNPNVSFIIDIGGQDIKCFKIKNNSIDSIMLNEACSSGCGSFIETFAKSMGKSIEEFASIGLFAKHPVDLGSRCTVFMNSSVKQAQKDGAGVDDISAGLSISVVKNALYKVIRVANADELGKNIVVQGGTFYNDAILKSFEREIGRNVIRPNIAGLMGAYGAALYAQTLSIEKSAVLDESMLKEFTHKSTSINCNGCANQCHLTVNTFNDNSKYISGNKCEKPLGISNKNSIPNIYEYKRNRIASLKAEGEFKRGCVGLPLGLSMYENAPFWFSFFKAIDVKPIFSDFSTVETYNIGRYSIPSDTACYPAKLMHGHIEELIGKGITNIFYPSLTYNFDEGKGDNHYNCPIVAYYSELLKRNIPSLDKVNFMYPYFGLHRRNDFVKLAYKYFKEIYKDITKEEVKKASDIAYRAYYDWQIDLQTEGKKALQYAKENSLLTIVLAGRPYHIDPEINHGIDKLINSLNIVVVSEDCVSDFVEPAKVNVLNQWTYHARLYNAAKYCTLHKDIQLVQLVSFGCGIDAITTDEVRQILEDGGKYYTQLKIDEINNLGAVKIRIRSLLGAIGEGENTSGK